MAYLDPTLARVEVTESVVEDAVALEVAPDTPAVDPEAPAEPAETAPQEAITPRWEEALEAFGDEPEVFESLQAMAVAGMPEPDAESIGGEVSGIPVVAQWPAAKVLLLFAEDVEDLQADFEAEGFAAPGADFGAAGTVPESLTAALEPS